VRRLRGRSIDAVRVLGIDGDSSVFFDLGERFGEIVYRAGMRYLDHSSHFGRVVAVRSD